MKNHTQNGSIIFYILLAIVLFAALGFAVSSSMRGGSKALSDEMLELQAEEILSYAAKMKETVKTLQLINDCADTEISFESTEWGHTDYDNGSAPDECKVFDPAGGGLKWTSPSNDLTTLEWEFIANGRVHGIGDSTAGIADSVDLIIALPNISDELCQTINNKISINTIPTDYGDLIDSDTGRFNGTYASDDNITGSPSSSHDCDDVESLLCAKSMGCFQETMGNQYNIFYQVLIAR